MSISFTVTFCLFLLGAQMEVMLMNKTSEAANGTTAKGSSTVTKSHSKITTTTTEESYSALVFGLLCYLFIGILIGGVIFIVCIEQKANEKAKQEEEEAEKAEHSHQRSARRPAEKSAKKRPAEAAHGEKRGAGAKKNSADPKQQSSAKQSVAIKAKAGAPGAALQAKSEVKTSTNAPSNISKGK
ncbi:hypothetical protein TYRP_013319 [Tyrophagus putrescentiae]|nr:hypothetical protein TYRP_013319 [Tyrophagus putrescentiae]